MLVSVIPWPCQRVDKYLHKLRPIQHLHQRKPSQSTPYKNISRRNRLDALFSSTIFTSPVTTDKQARVVIPTCLFSLLLKPLNCGNPTFILFFLHSNDITIMYHHSVIDLAGISPDFTFDFSLTDFTHSYTYRVNLQDMLFFDTTTRSFAFPFLGLCAPYSSNRS